MKIYLNGKFVLKEDAKISVFDHGFLYGDGVFEGIRSYDGLVFKLDEHLNRLYETAHTLMIQISLTKKELRQAIIDTLKVNHLKGAYIRVIVTRGEGDLGLDPRKCKGKTNIVIITDKITLYPDDLYKKGMAIITVPTPRNFPDALNPQLKSLNYLNNILAKIEANNSGFNEAIMLDGNGYVAECTGDNIFMIKWEDKRPLLLTPPTYLGALKGITRQAIIEIAAAQKIPFEERILTRHDLFNADEVFLTGTAAEVIPVVKIDGRRIGKGKPGPVTGTLRSIFRKRTQTDGVRYKI